MITLTYPDSKQVHYEYDAADQLITVTDWANRVTRYDYDKNGRLISIVRPNGTQQTRVYDLAGQLLQQKEVVIKTGEVISQVDFSYDAAGNIIEEKTSPEADPNINLEMTYAKANRLASYDDETVQLDADGNLIQGPLSGEMADFVFDSRNRLIQAGETTYHYDAENQRIGVNQTQYVINSQPALSQVLVKTEASGTQTYYVYGLGLIGQEQDGEYLSYHFDYRGSTKALTDKTGQVTERFQYSPYGLLVSGDASTTPFLFNGMYGVMTDSNGLYYMRARFYSPEMRRFVNQDVLLGNIFDGQTLNRYAYVTGQPVSFVDPFGLSKCGLIDFNNPDDFLACLFDEAYSIFNSEVYIPNLPIKVEPNEVFLCKRPIAISWLPSILTDYILPRHHWILTQEYESGMGANCPIPGQGCSDMPYTSTKTKGHEDQAARPNAYCQRIENVDVECVNELIKPEQPTGLWTISNQCQTFARSVLIRCNNTFNPTDIPRCSYWSGHCSP